MLSGLLTSLSKHGYPRGNFPGYAPRRGKIDDCELAEETRRFTIGSEVSLNYLSTGGSIAADKLEEPCNRRALHGFRKTGTRLCNYEG